MQKLRNELVSLYTVDTIRRIATECLVPMVSQTFSLEGASLREKAERRFTVITSKTVRETVRSYFAFRFGSCVQPLSRILCFAVFLAHVFCGRRSLISFWGLDFAVFKFLFVRLSYYGRRF